MRRSISSGCNVFLFVLFAFGGVLSSVSSAASSTKTMPFSLVLERQVDPGAPFRVLVVAERPPNRLTVRVGRGRLRSKESDLISTDYPFARIYHGRASQRRGVYEVTVSTDAGVSTRTRVIVSDRPLHRARPLPATGVWASRRDWDDHFERVFSAWVMHLFRPIENQRNKGWRRLHDVIHNPSRNFLFNRLGYGEDSTESATHIRAVADCGDTPYFLRAYFAWKLNLPFRYRRCTRGDGRRGPTCRVDINNETADLNDRSDPVARFNAFYETLIVRQVHSGTMRTLPSDNGSDFYPIALNRAAIRPGTVFVDSGGHALVVTQWDDDGLYAIDGHPDKTVTRRRFGPRYFHYYKDLNTGGFKAFRPIEKNERTISPVPNRALDRFFSLEQYTFSSTDEFYHHMSGLLDTTSGK